MFIVTLELSDNRDSAGRLMADHNDWIKRGFDDGVFVLVGTLQPKRGGVVIAHGTSLSELTARVNADPFVVEGVVVATIAEVTPARADARLQFLLD